MKTIDIDQPGFFAKHQVGDEAAGFYAAQGYLVVHDAVSPAEIQELRDEAVAICRQERGEMKIHETHEQEMPPLEELRTLPDDEAIRHFLCIHFPHKISSVMQGYLAHPVVVDVLTRVISPNVKAMQSMLFVKSAGKPGQAWHQDEDYIPTRDRSLAGAWIALDDAVIENGCLWVIPGSQRPGILWPQYPHDDRKYDCAQMSYDFPYSDADAVPVEVPAGAIVFFNGYLLHKSEPNTQTSGYRRALVNHYMSAESLLPWHGSTGPAATADTRDIVMVAGTDPYAWKGIADTATAGIRPAGEGGCGDGRVDLYTHRQNLEDAAKA